MLVQTLFITEATQSLIVCQNTRHYLYTLNMFTGITTRQIF